MRTTRSPTRRWSCATAPSTCCWRGTNAKRVAKRRGRVHTVPCPMLPPMLRNASTPWTVCVCTTKMAVSQLPPCREVRLYQRALRECLFETAYVCERCQYSGVHVVPLRHATETDVVPTALATARTREDAPCLGKRAVRGCTPRHPLGKGEPAKDRACVAASHTAATSQRSTHTQKRAAPRPGETRRRMFGAWRRQSAALWSEDPAQTPRACGGTRQWRRAQPSLAPVDAAHAQPRRPPPPAPASAHRDRSNVMCTAHTQPHTPRLRSPRQPPAAHRLAQTGKAPSPRAAYIAAPPTWQWRWTASLWSRPGA